MKTALTIIGVVALILGVGYIAISSEEKPAPQASTASETEDTSPSEAAANTEATEETEGDTTDQESEVAGVAAEGSGTYEEYSAEAVAGSDADHILLFFHATWCTSCRALDEDIKENASNIPSDVAIYKVDYDTATDLKRQYGVTTQHSIIEISAAGEAESSISHPRSLSGVLGTI